MMDFGDWFNQTTEELSRRTNGTVHPGLTSKPLEFEGIKPDGVTKREAMDAQARSNRLAEVLERLNGDLSRKNLPGDCFYLGL